MLYRILAALIICFWLVMSALLVRVEFSPGNSQLIEIPPSYVMKLMFRHGQSSDLNVFENKKPIGAFSLRPKPVDTENRRVLDFSGHLLVGLPLAPRTRVALDGSVEMDRQLDVQVVRFNSKAQDSDYTTQITVDSARRMMSYAAILKGKVADERTFSLDDFVSSGALSQLGVDEKLLTSLKQRYASPVVIARASELSVGNEKVDAYQLTVRQGDSVLAEIYVNQLGQVLLVTTSFGYTLSTQAVLP